MIFNDFKGDCIPHEVENLDCLKCWGCWDGKTFDFSLLNVFPARRL
jgi:hypothetical protein